MSHDQSPNKKSLSSTLILSLAALGVVYGDIGTSPLYAIKEIFFGHSLRGVTAVDIFGAISVVFWALTIIVTFKYIIFVLRADADGEGGIFALYSLINGLGKKHHVWIIGLIVFASGLLFGDGIITPAISVISAVEGLKLATPVFEPYVVPITIAILTLLFGIQSKGTSKVGAVFGPVMLVWFAALAVLGGMHIMGNPEIFAAINPMHALGFFLHHDIRTIFLVLGSVMLVVTGGEAMYADMGHFGKLPIRLGWLVVAYPALVLNYFGQGAYLLSGKPVQGGNLFFSMVPSVALIPMIILATFATVIASQALISGAFSLTVQAIQLRLFPYLPVKHTHREHEGQTYVHFVNWALYAGAVLLVLYFQSSSRLASAYGLAVSGDMLVTSLSMIIVLKEIWKWPAFFAYLLFIPLMLIDATFLTANSLKFFEGGFIPVFIALGMFTITKAWKWGRDHVAKTFDEYPVMTVKELIAIKEKNDGFMPRTVVLMTPKLVTNEDDAVPPLKQIFWDRYGILPKHLIFLTVSTLKVPHAAKKRYEVYNLYEEKGKGTITSVKVSFGFMEEHDVEKVLEGIADHDEVPLHKYNEDWLIHVVHERVRAGKLKDWRDRIKFAIYKFMAKNTDTADHYFGLGKRHPLTAEILPITIR